MTDTINPSYYNRGGTECIDAIATATKGLAGQEAFCTGSAMKYLWRWKDKGGIDDLRKAHWYIRRLIDNINRDELVKEM